MENTKLSDHKKKLEKERGELLGEIQTLEKQESFGDDVDDFEEKTNEAEEIGNQLAASGDLKKRLDEIDIALSKIREGSYGVCEKCKMEIGDDVLSVNPEAAVCKKCATM